MRVFFSIYLFFSFFIHFALGKEIVLPAFNAPVIDEVQFFKANEIQNLENSIREIRRLGGPQIAVYAVQNLQGEVIEEFSIKVAEKWQLGSKEKDDGLLIIIAKEERAVRVEVGNGIEGEITDYIASYYAKDLMPKYFKQGYFFEGVNLVLSDIAERFNITLTQAPQSIIKRKVKPLSSRNSSWLEFAFILVAVILSISSGIFPKRPLARGIFSGLFITLIFIPAVLSIFWYVGIFFLSLIAGTLNVGSLLFAMMSHRSSGRGGGWGSGGGGGWSGGGGGFSGGGSSGRW